MEIYEELKERYRGIEEYCTESGDWEDQGTEDFKAGRYPEAVENFERVIAAIPDHYNAYEMCSYALYKSDEREKAITYLEKAVEVARSFDGEAELPQEMIEDMEESLRRMRSNEELDAGYIAEIME